MSLKGRCLLAFLLTAVLILPACSASTPQSRSQSRSQSRLQDETAIPTTIQPAPTTPAPAPSATLTNTLMPTRSPEPTLTSTLEPSLTPTSTPEPCSPAKEGPLAGVNPREQRIIWWHHYSSEKDLYALVFEFNYTNECELYVDLKYQGSYAAIHDKMVSAFQMNNPPDLVVGYQNDQAFYQKENRLVDINPYLDDLAWGLPPEEQADFYPSFWDQSVHPAYENQRLGFALNRSMEVLFYNTTWAAELGFEQPPSTPEELEAQACAAAAHNNDGTGGLILRNNASALAAWTFAFGGEILDETGARYVFDSQPTIHALSMLKRLYDQGCAFYNQGYADRAFAGRRALFTQGSSSGLPFYIENLAKSGTGDQLELIALPHTTSRPRQNVYGGDILIPQTTPERQLAAWIFVKWLTSPRVQSIWVKVSSYYPTRQSTSGLLTRFMNKNPVWASGYELLPFAAYEPQLGSYDAVRDLMSKTFDRILRGDGTGIEQQLETLTESANQLQEEFNR